MAEKKYWEEAVVKEVFSLQQYSKKIIKKAEELLMETI